MACTQPNTISPGFLRVDYTHVSQSLVHGTRARILLGIDPLDSATMQTTADAWAAVLGGITTGNFLFTGFTVLRPDGSLLYNGALSAVVVGSHALATGGKDLKSLTLAFTGHGMPASTTTCAGEEVSRVFCGGAYEWVPGQGFVVQGLDAGADAVAAFLRASDRIWGDEYGQKASVRSRYPTQHNGFAQNHWGA